MKRQNLHPEHGHSEIRDTYGLSIQHWRLYMGKQKNQIKPSLWDEMFQVAMVIAPTWEPNVYLNKENHVVLEWRSWLNFCQLTFTGEGYKLRFFWEGYPTSHQLKLEPKSVNEMLRYTSPWFAEISNPRES